MSRLYDNRPGRTKGIRFSFGLPLTCGLLLGGAGMILVPYFIPHSCRTNFGLGRVYMVGLGLVFFSPKFDYMWLKLSA
jgi:hypothetical protein